MSAQQKPVRIQSSLHASFRQAKRRRGVPHAKAIPRSASPHTKKQSPVASSLLESALALPPSPAVRQGKHVEACGAHQCARAAPCRVVSCGIVWCRVVCVAHRLMLVPPSRRHRVVGEQGHAASPPPDPARPLPRGAPPPLAPPSSRLPPAPPRPSPAHRRQWCHRHAAGLALELQRHVPAPCWRVV